MEVIKFVVHKTPYACWDWHLKEKNLAFLEGIDAYYFQYIAALNAEHIESDDKHRAALSLRLAYSHGLEALFALLCSVVQAPQCTIGWIINYRNSDILNIVKKISRGEFVYTRFHEKPVTWDVLAKHIHSDINYHAEKKAWIQRGFGKLWASFASEFEDIHFSNEYNGIKHGLRVKPGGFHLAFGFEDSPGAPVASEKMMSLGGSEFGSSYFVKEQILPSDKCNFRPRRHFRNWNPNNLINGLVHVSMSINNVTSWLRIINGREPSKCKFENPMSEGDFDAPWKEHPGIDNFNMDLIMKEENISPFTQEDIVKSYN